MAAPRQTAPQAARAPADEPVKHAALPAPATPRIAALQAAIELRSGSSNADSILRSAMRFEQWLSTGESGLPASGA